MSISVFELFTIGIGPSSSHTVGPMRAARRFAERLATDGMLDHTARVEVELFGSLAATGRGHGTDRAILMGLEGETPEGIDPDCVGPRVEAIRKHHEISLLGRHPIPFDEASDLVFNRRDLLPLHSNGMRFVARDAAGAEIERRVYYSVGGGFVVNEGATGNDRVVADTTAVAHPFRSGEDLLQLSEETGLAIWELMLENERSWRSDEEIRAGILRIWRAMEACVERGCRQTGVLPGGLKVPRRAPALYQDLLAKAGRNGSADPLTVLDWVNLFALAVNEENAAGGRVVTAPTNGAAGVIPAVLRYYESFVAEATEEGARDQVLVELGSPPRHLQAPRQDAGLPAAALDAGLHGRPDAEEAGADLLVAPPGALVVEHQLPDGEPGRLRELKEVLAAAERVGDRGRVGDHPVGAGRPLVDHEAAADRVVDALLELGAVGVEGGEAHAVRVGGEEVAVVEDEVRALVEADRMAAEEGQLAAGADRRDQRAHAVRVDPLRRLAFQAEEDGPVGAVPAAGRGERAEELDRHPRGPREQAVRRQPLGEPPRRPHRPHRMRARRPDADGEEIEDADRHAKPTLRRGLYGVGRGEDHCESATIMIRQPMPGPARRKRCHDAVDPQGRPAGDPVALSAPRHRWRRLRARVTTVRRAQHPPCGASGATLVPRLPSQADVPQQLHGDPQLHGHPGVHGKLSHLLQQLLGQLHLRRELRAMRRGPSELSGLLSHLRLRGDGLLRLLVLQWERLPLDHLRRYAIRLRHPLLAVRRPELTRPT